MCTKALFLDRDGVINVNTEYLHSASQLTWVEGIFEILSFFKQKGFLLLMVTNQSGIHRHYFSFSEFSTLSLFMQEYLHFQLGFGLDRIYFCPHLPQEECACRKPKAGMIAESLHDFPQIQLSSSVLIGDSWTDILAARNAGIQKSFWLNSSTTKEESLQELKPNEIRISHLQEVIDLF
ncbi:hypothetical protein CCZ01_06190 [Helicobacter monodelphidis]|uniref:D-glycero-alpha-D-manno-heptose-1,7-bisphosphate 7-phosphatase n=1 Tax=Helicobacter sp. 15-1451 TaxID=2004995 RepID=UPI000DCB85E8|nr:HAD family hydrolase [Helicobacter sp. 15-1451]RAX57424.1 hypothetical protein CCZ01_06190 [Helicobacter sp. 15-1451]